MKIYDFDEKFFDYVRTWMAIHPGLNEKQLEQSYNEIMLNWLNSPASWLDGVTPGAYFDRYSEPRDFQKLLESYDSRDIGLPEPLYSRIVYLGEVCVPMLTKLCSDSDRSESIRATALALLRDIAQGNSSEMFIDMLCDEHQPDELCEMVCDILSSGDGSCVPTLLDRYDSVGETAKMRILDVCVQFPGDKRIFDHCIYKLMNDPDHRALYASYLEKIGNPEALDMLQRCLTLSDIGYLDYIEVRNAVEALGGDPGEERTFYGDPDYEAMRNM